MHHNRLLEAQERGAAARANAVRFAEQVLIEDDEAMKTYLRHLAVSWAQTAERYEFVVEVEARRTSSDQGAPAEVTASFALAPAEKQTVLLPC